MEIINNNAKVEQVEIISNDNQNNNKNNFCLPPLFCIPSSTIIIGQDVEQKKHQKYYSKIAGLQQLIACCILISKREELQKGRIFLFLTLCDPFLTAINAVYLLI